MWQNAYAEGHAGPVSGDISTSRSTSPRTGDRAVPADQIEVSPLGGSMFRLQAPLPQGYVTSTDEDLARRIRAAKEQLGSRLMILDHHYQRDEVMRWADARGDSFGLSRLAAPAE